jgi:hypothetical protein
VCLGTEVSGGSERQRDVEMERKREERRNEAGKRDRGRERAKRSEYRRR